MPDSDPSRLRRIADVLLTGIAIGVALAALAGMGVTAMAIYVAATERDRYADEHCIDDAP